VAIVLVATAIYAIDPGAASARSQRAASTPTDRAAVHAYILDRYVYVQAVVEAAPAIVGAYEGAASRIAGECPGVLVGAPQGTWIEVGSGIPSRTARQRGEEKRRITQLSDLEEELSSELASAEREPRRSAVTAFVANLKALPQGDPELTQTARMQLIGLEEELQVESTDVCADMSAWAGSGYRTLSPTSRAIALKRETELVGFFKDLPAQSATESIPGTETPADKALVRKTNQLELQAAKTLVKSIESARKRVEAALGLTARADREKRSKPISHESNTSTKLGTIRTAAGTKYTVWLERTKGGPAGECKLSVEVRRASGAKPGLLEILSSESGVCFAPHNDRSEGPSVKCSEGLLKIESEVPSTTRTVGLRMSNGTQITSRPVLVPRRLGGPDAFYYQAVRGPSPIPVSLVERDAQGRTLRVVKLQRIVGCSKHPLKYLPGGKRTLVHGQTPQGPDFSIVGERYRLFGRIHTQLKLRTGEGLTTSDEGEEEGPIEGPGALPRSFAVPVKHPKPLESEVSAGCHPHEYSIFYGLLKNPRDTVLAKVAGKLVPVLRVRIPSSLHTGGTLVYLASVSQPEEVLVRSPNGKIRMNENRSRTAREGRETCEGESEGAGPPPGGFGATGETSRIVLNG
jgi:hypothetical protein